MMLMVGNELDKGGVITGRWNIRHLRTIHLYNCYLIPETRRTVQYFCEHIHDFIVYLELGVMIPDELGP